MASEQTVRVHLTVDEDLERGWANTWIYDGGPQNGHPVAYSSVNGTLVWLNGRPYVNTQSTNGIATFPTHAEAQAWLDSLPVREVPAAQVPTRPVRPAAATAACANCGAETPRSLLMRSSVAGAVCPDCYDTVESEA